MKKICEFCKKEFDANNNKTKFCSKSCSVKYRWDNDEYKEKLSKIQKNRWTDECKKESSEKMIKKWNDSEYYNRIVNLNRLRYDDPITKNEISIDISKRMKLLWNDNEYKEKMIKLKQDKANDLEWIEKMTKINQDKANDSKWIEKMTKINQENTSKQEYKDKISKIQLKIWENEEYKDKMSKIRLEKWNDPIYAEKRMKQNFKYKNYILPSGKVIKIQGYEDKALDILLSMYDESDIYITTKDITKQIGKIKYFFENKEHNYYPDIYIKSVNKIIEVKSEWSYNISKNKNDSKKIACIQLGFNFEFFIL